MTFEKGNTASKGVKKPFTGRKPFKDANDLHQLLLECWTVPERKKCIRALVQMALEGDKKAIQILLERAWGKPKESMELTGQSGGAIDIQVTYRTETPNEV